MFGGSNDSTPDFLMVPWTFFLVPILIRSMAIASKPPDEWATSEVSLLVVVAPKVSREAGIAERQSMLQVFKKKTMNHYGTS
jgi:hypothetical protein